MTLIRKFGWFLPLATLIANIAFLIILPEVAKEWKFWAFTTFFGAIALICYKWRQK